MSEECFDLVLALNVDLTVTTWLHATKATEAPVKLCTLPLLAGANMGV
jgi:pilus assembly protein CpaF